MIKECKKHGATDHRKRTDRKDGFACKKCVNETMTRYRERNMQKAYESKGGKCERCGYDKCVDALEFHHEDPSKKGFMINKSLTMSWKKIEPELDKCILVCANCHREIHWEIKKNDG